MLGVMSWIGLVGAWLLVAGPVYQATLELRAHDIERDRVQAMARTVDVPRASRLWWLIPPLGWYLTSRRRTRYFNAVLAVLEPVDVRALLGLYDKAFGWMLVASGALLLAVKETFSFAMGQGLATGPAIAIAAGLLSACVGLTRARARQSKRLLVRHGGPRGEGTVTG